jgi:hypothetical protein
MTPPAYDNFHGIDRLAAGRRRLRNLAREGGFRTLTDPAMTGLMGWLVIGFFADLGLGAHNLAEAVVIPRLQSFFGAGHALVSSRH